MGARRHLTLAALLDHPAVAGVAVGACADGSGALKERAHAHAPSKDGPDRWVGWICVRSASDLSYAELLLEELAHLVAPTERQHDAVFYATRRQLRESYRTRALTRGAARRGAGRRSGGRC